LGVADRVEFCGFVANPADLYARADVFLMLSRHEGLPLALLEAMASGLPVIATDTGGIGEVVRHGRDGLLLPATPTSDQLADRIANLSGRPEVARALGRKARIRIENRFTVEGMVREYRDLFRSLDRPSRRREASRRNAPPDEARRAVMMRDSFLRTGLELRPVMEQIVASVRQAPPEGRHYAQHIDRLGLLMQYAYYVDLIRRHVDDREAAILDWGGQYGQVTRMLFPYYRNVTCYLCDREQHFAEWFHEKLGIASNVRFGEGFDSADRIHLPDASFDVVLSSGVLEHTREHGVAEGTALAEINRVLTDKGLLLIWNLPRKHSFVEAVQSLLGRSVHRYKYGRREICEMLESRGFRVVALDEHELLFTSLRHRLGQLVGHARSFVFDYYLSKLPLVRHFNQHFTIVAQKTRSLTSARGGPARTSPARATEAQPSERAA
jgi:SAM-dependent methyltransferase